MRPPLKFHGSPAQMTAAALPMLGFCINRMSMNEHLGFFSFFIAIGLVMLGLCWGLGPAFFPRVDHPLHKLDRIRWICGCICFLVLVVSSMVSDGAVHVFLRLRPHMQLSLEDFAEGKADGAGLVTLEAHLDLSRIGAAAHCSDCTASECAKKDCRAEAGLSPLSSEIPLLRIDDLDAYSDSSELFGRRLSGAGAGGGGGGGGSSSGKKQCSITCVYAAPLSLTSDADFPMAWAVGSSWLPRHPSGTTKFTWWTGERQDYARAMDEAVAQQLPERLKAFTHRACDGQRAVPNSENWWSKCRSSGFINCRARSLAGKCCCHVGERLGDNGCESCGALQERLSALHQLPLLYSLAPDAGLRSFYLMLICSFVLLPLPWAVLARVLWQLAEPTESFLQHEARHQRKHIAETWTGTANLHGPLSIQVVNMAGQCRTVSGFRESSLLVHLRRSVAEVFSVDFQQIGLVFGGELLSPDLDFKTLGDLGIHDECTVSFVLSQVESTPRKERLAGHSEGNALAFFRRNRNVYKALDCPHLGQLRLARGTVANFGREYAKGWNCDGCERHFASGTQLYRCDFCQIDFCQECAAE
ncbi:unnamed protein product [Durusdinium trenchii]|uniref:Ubiquitin-like domain-containing protein n=1 Tax=Durusdinium trenchii TaxID=1381693 RepID=A0ABP0IIF9_9DINO